MEARWKEKYSGLKNFSIYSESYFYNSLLEYCNFSDITTYYLSFINDNFKKIREENINYSFITKLENSIIPKFITLIKGDSNFTMKELLHKFFTDKYSKLKVLNISLPYFTEVTHPEKFVNIGIDFTKFTESFKDNESYRNVFKNFFDDFSSTFNKKDAIKHTSFIYNNIYLFEFYLTLFFAKKMEDQEELDLANYMVSGGTQYFSCLSRAIIAVPTLKILNVSGNNLEKNGFFLLAKSLLVNDSITNLDLSFNKMDSEQLKIFCQVVTSNKRDKKWQVLSIANNTFNYLAGDDLANLIFYCKDLRDFNISKNAALKGGFKPVLEEILNMCKNLNCSLQRLYLAKTNIPNSCFGLLNKILQEKYCLIETLQLSGNSMKKPNPFFSNFPIFPNIRELILAKCEIDDDLMDDITDFLLVNRQIFSFSLYNNNLKNPQNVINILRICNTTHCMANIDFGCNFIEFEKRTGDIAPLVEIGNILKPSQNKSKTNLKVVDLGNNNFGHNVDFNNSSTRDNTGNSNKLPDYLKEFAAVSLELQNDPNYPIQLLF